MVFGVIFLMGIVFIFILVIGVCFWILCNFFFSIVYGVGIGIGLFFLLIVVINVKLVINSGIDIFVKMGEFILFFVMMLLFGLVVIVGLECLKVKGLIFWVIIVIIIIVLIFDLNVKYFGFFKMLSFGENLLFLELDVMGVLNVVILFVVFVLVMIVIFDVIGIICVVVG